MGRWDHLASFTRYISCVFRFSTPANAIDARSIRVIRTVQAHHATDDSWA